MWELKRREAESKDVQNDVNIWAVDYLIKNCSQVA